MVPDLGVALPDITKRLAVAILVGAVLLLAGFGHGNAPSARAAFSDADGDGVPDQTEIVFGSDPHDATSTPEAAGYIASLIFLTSNPATCTDGVDNDKDGLIDSADPACTDSDSDGIPDPVERLLGSDPRNESSVPEDARFDNVLAASILPFQFCHDGVDDDRDGLIDARDPGCSAIDTDGDGFDDATEKSLGSDWLHANSMPENEAVNPGSCTDGIDNDHDGLIDAADPGCVTLRNDNVANAAAVTSLPFDDTTKNLAATVEVGEQTPSCAFGVGAGGDIEATAWYSFTAPADMPVVIDTTGSDFAALVGVWTADQASYSEVACNNSFLLSPSTRFAFQATHGVRYLIQAGRNRYLYPGGGKLTVHMEAGVTPVNDNFADAATISAIPFSVSVDVVAATTEAGEPDRPSCTRPRTSFGPALNTVWYRYTPAKDTYVLADTRGTDLLTNVLSVYQGPALGNLGQIACSGGASVGPYASNPAELAFLARAGQTYYLQAGSVGPSFGGPTTSRTPAAAALLTGGTHITLNLHIFDVPSCPAAQFTIPDRVGDPIQATHDVPPDILSLSGAFTADRLCVTVRLDRQINDLFVNDLYIGFDTDQDRSTGFTDQDRSNSYYGVDTLCQRPTGLGVDIGGLVSPSEGLVLQLDPAPSSGERAVALVNGSSYTMIFPLSALGGDDRLSFAVDVASGSDCTPDGGSVRCGGGTCTFSPFRNGDASCNGPADAVDAAIILQSSAGLLASVACPDAADVNGDRQINSLDAALILQFSAGLIDQLPPSCRFCRP